MKRSLYETLARSRIVRDYEKSFPSATGFVLKILPPAASKDLTPFGPCSNPFCSLMSCSPRATQYCKRTFANVQNKAAGKLALVQQCCFAGMVHVALPVVAAGEHICTLYGGQLLLKKPTKQEFDKISSELVRLGLESHLPLLKKAWFNTPIISAKQLQAIMYLLRDFSDRISRFAATSFLEPVDGEPAYMTSARRYIQDHSSEPITMPDAANHLNLSKSNFCKIFKRTVGLTFTQYLARVRVEKAKRMLANPAARIHEIASESGFDSLSQFNRVFRKYAEMSPTEYRATLAGAVVVASKQEIASSG